MKKFLSFVVILVGAAWAAVWIPGCSQAKPDIYTTGDSVVFETAHAAYSVAKEGLNRSFVYTTDGKDRLNHSDPQPFMYAYKEGDRYQSTGVDFSHNTLEVSFGGTDIRASFKVTAEKEWILFELLEVAGTVDKLRITNLSISDYDTFGAVINACYDDDFALCVQAVDYNVISVPLDREDRSLFEFFFMGLSHQRTKYPEDSTILTASVEKATGMAGARVAVIACPGTKLLESIEKLELKYSLPHPTIDGMWGRNSAESKKSYIFCSYNEDSIDQAIRTALDGGFRFILSSFPRARGTHLDIDRNRFPGGLDGLKRCVDKIHSAGLKAGIHLLTAGIPFDDPNVSPVPDKRLVKENEFELAADMDAAGTTVPVSTSPEGLNDRYSYEYFTPGIHLQIGDEIIKYSHYTVTPPFRFTGCIRGALGTKPAAHTQGEKVYHLGERYGHFVVDVETSLLDEVTQPIAQIVNTCGFDMMYLDGAEFNDAQGSRYYMNKFIDALYQRFNRDVLLQASIFDNYSWHYISRMTSNDAALGGIREFLDVLRMDNINLYKDNFVPADFGWYGLFANSVHSYATLPEEIEYGLAKSIAHNEAFGLQAGLGALQANGRTGEILDLIKNYEALRLKNYFSRSIKDQLKETGYDFKLNKSSQGKWFFRKWKLAPDFYVQNPQTENTWTIKNEFGSQPLAVRIRAAHNPAEYEDKRNITLIDISNVENIYSEAEKGISSMISISREVTKSGSPSLKIETKNSTDSIGSWAAHTLYHKERKNLIDNRMLGTWIHGDGSGALLNLHMETPGRRAKDYYVDLTFKGWKYVVIPRWEGGRVFDYPWPYVWKFNLRPINWRNVDRSAIYISAVPPATKTTCYITPLKAIRLENNSIKNPSISVNGKTITFPGELKQDQYLEFRGGGKCIFYDADNHIIKEVEPVGDIPVINPGENTIEFFCDVPSPGQGGAYINIMTQGPVLSK